MTEIIVFLLGAVFSAIILFFNFTYKGGKNEKPIDPGVPLFDGNDSKRRAKVRVKKLLDALRNGKSN